MNRINKIDDLIEVPIKQLMGFDFTPFLPHGAMKEIVARTNEDQSLVSRVANGKMYREHIIEAILDYINESKRVKVPLEIAEHSINRGFKNGADNVTKSEATKSQIKSQSENYSNRHSKAV